ncbi:MAG TPA: hypothetical protein VI603_18620 [Saprospiraceae bacterium]|nr:hypothetical protein [Saprospiraceae bacterium]
MDIQEILHERIEAYLKGTLDSAQQAEFERQLGSDDALRKEVERHRQATLAINYSLAQSLKDRLKTIEQEIGQPAKPISRRLPVFRQLAIAASFLILLAAGAYFYTQRTYDTGAVAERFFATTQSEQFRGREEYVISLGERFAEAERFFHEGDYEAAKQQYLMIIKEDSLLKGQAEWNLALCYYALDPAAPQFKMLLERILSDTRHDYHAQALKLQKTIDSVMYKLVNR